MKIVFLGHAVATPFASPHDPAGLKGLFIAVFDNVEAANLAKSSGKIGVVSNTRTQNTTGNMAMETSTSTVAQFTSNPEKAFSTPLIRLLAEIGSLSQQAPMLSSSP
jgi:hypothetical protein